MHSCVCPGRSGAIEHKTSAVRRHSWKNPQSFCLICPARFVNTSAAASAEPLEAQSNLRSWGERAPEQLGVSRKPRSAGQMDGGEGLLLRRRRETAAVTRYRPAREMQAEQGAHAGDLCRHAAPCELLIQRTAQLLAQLIQPSNSRFVIGPERRQPRRHGQGVRAEGAAMRHRRLALGVVEDGHVSRGARDGSDGQTAADDLGESNQIGLQAKQLVSTTVSQPIGPPRRAPAGCRACGSTAQDIEQMLAAGTMPIRDGNGSRRTAANAFHVLEQQPAARRVIERKDKRVIQERWRLPRA